MDKKKEIVDIADNFDRIEKRNEDKGNEALKQFRFRVYNMIETAREKTAKDILYYLKANITDNLLKNHEIINELIKAYGVEVK